MIPRFTTHHPRAPTERAQPGGEHTFGVTRAGEALIILRLQSVLFIDERGARAPPRSRGRVESYFLCLGVAGEPTRYGRDRSCPLSDRPSPRPGWPFRLAGSFGPEVRSHDPWYCPVQACRISAMTRSASFLEALRGLEDLGQSVRLILRLVAIASNMSNDLALTFACSARSTASARRASAAISMISSASAVERPSRAIRPWSRLSTRSKASSPRPSFRVAEIDAAGGDSSMVQATSANEKRAKSHQPPPIAIRQHRQLDTQQGSES